MDLSKEDGSLGWDDPVLGRLLWSPPPDVCAALQSMEEQDQVKLGLAMLDILRVRVRKIREALLQSAEPKVALEALRVLTVAPKAPRQPKRLN